MANSKFDSTFYTKWYQDASNLDPKAAEKQWLDIGGPTKRFGNFEDLAKSKNVDAADVPPNFDWAAYKELNEDIPSSWNEWNCKLHFLTHGLDEGRSYRRPSLSLASDFAVDEILGFDSEWYMHTHELADEDVALDHYNRIGKSNLLAPNGNFSPLDYWKRFGDIAKARRHPIDHYRDFGHIEGRQVVVPSVRAERSRIVHSRPALHAAREFFGFDLSHYRENRPDLRKADDEFDFFEHYRLAGESEGTRPSRFFDPQYYRERYGEELKSWPGTALEHFTSIGILLGHLPSAEVASGVRRRGLKSVVSWVGFWTGSEWIDSIQPKSANNNTALESHSGHTIHRSTRAKRKRLNWVIPAFSKGGGGHTTIFRTARTLSRLGWESVFWIAGDKTASQVDALYAEFIGHYPISLVTFRRVQEGFHQVQDEVLVASSWDTAYIVSDNHLDNARLYFVQDRESQFMAAGTQAMQAEWTYQLGFDFVCAGRWLEELVSPFGGLHKSFELCAEPMFSSNDRPLAEREVLAAIYVRGHSERRASGMMAEVATRLSELGLGEVVIFGDDHPDYPVGDNVVNAGILTPAEMAELFHRTRFGLVASATNYSILPVELGAAGTVVVQPASQSTRETTDARGAHSVEPTVDALVDFVSQHAANLTQESFDQLRGAYFAFTRELSWERELMNVGEWIEEHFLDRSQSRISAKPKKTVGVIIPTYYPGPEFMDVIGAVRDQLTSYEVQFQIIDSRIDGRVAPVIEQIERQELAMVHVIDAMDFSHGPESVLA
ncbi:hypothetical protein GCM10027591_00070 [Zhihengliuella somnathii]